MSHNYQIPSYCKKETDLRGRENLKKEKKKKKKQQENPFLEGCIKAGNWAKFQALKVAISEF